MASASAEGLAVAEADAAAMVVGRETGGGPAGGIEARDATTLAFERGPVGVGDESPSVKVTWIAPWSTGGGHHELGVEARSGLTVAAAFDEQALVI